MRQPNAGETQNGGTLYDRFAPTLFPYLYAQTASVQDAEDLLLEVFIAAFAMSNSPDCLTSSNWHGCDELREIK